MPHEWKENQVWGFGKGNAPLWALRMEKRIMAKLEEYVNELKASLDGIGPALDGLSTDLSTLDAKVSELQAAQGNLTPEQEAALQGVVASAASIRDRAVALDAVRPENLPEPPASE